MITCKIVVDLKHSMTKMQIKWMVKSILLLVIKEYEEHLIDGENAETHSLMACKLAYNKPKKQEHPQRHSVLRMRCTINDKIYITL